MEVIKMKTTVAKLILLCVSLMVIGLMLTGQSYAQIDFKTAVGIWLFDEGKDVVARDSSGNGNDGMLVDEPEWVEGQFGNALSFNGAGQVVKIPGFGMVAPESEISIVAWAKVERIKDQQDLFCLEPLGDNRITVHLPWSGSIYWQYGSPFSGSAMPWPADAAGNWKHWAFVASTSRRKFLTSCQQSLAFWFLPRYNLYEP